MKKILLVEDEPDILEVIRLILAKNSYSIRSATSGEQAMKLAREEKPDLMILDIMLPGQSGLEVCRQLKNDPDMQDIYIIILTAKAQKRDIRAGYAAGCDDYIVKPFNTLAMTERVQHVLGNE